MRFEDRFQSGDAIPRKVRLRRSRRARAAERGAKVFMFRHIERTRHDHRALCKLHGVLASVAFVSATPTDDRPLQRIRRALDKCERPYRMPMPQLPEGLRFVPASEGTLVSGDVYRFEVQQNTVKGI